MASALDSYAQATLVASARSGFAARLDLAALGQVAAQSRHVLIVDLLDVIDAEGANLAAGYVAVATPARTAGGATWTRSAAETTGATTTATRPRTAAIASATATAAPTGTARSTWSTTRSFLTEGTFLGSLLPPASIRVVCLVCHIPS